MNFKIYFAPLIACPSAVFRPNLRARCGQARGHQEVKRADTGRVYARTSHRDQVEQLIEKGRDIEKIVLSRAVRWHLEHCILIYGNKTVGLEQSGLSGFSKRKV